MAADKKVDLAIVMGKPTGKPGALGEKPEGEEADATAGGSVDAAQSIIDAIDVKDAGALAKALRAFVETVDSPEV